MRKKNAFSLSITLWITAALMAGAIYFIGVNRQNLYISSQLNDKLAASLELQSTFELLKYYIYLGTYSYNKIINKEQNLLPKSLPIDSTPFKYKNSTIQLQDSGGLLDTMHIQSYISNLEVFQNRIEEQVAKNSIKDWLDKDSFSSINGAETFYYTAKGCRYRTRNKPFLYYTDELNIIRGCQDILNSKENFIHSVKWGLNPYTMSKQVLKTIFQLSENDVKIVLDIRKNDITRFRKKLYELKPEVLRTMELFLIYSNVLKITITTKINKATVSKTFFLDFNSDTILYIN